MKMAKSMAPMSLTIQSGTTTPPKKVTDPRLTYKISVVSDEERLDYHTILQQRMHMTLYYNKRSDQDSGWYYGGWIKESLGKALAEEPILAARIRKSEDEHDRGLEIVLNDCGVRCFEAQTSLTLVEFLKSKDKQEFEAQLVYWQDVEATNPQFSPLFYVQVTNFQCGGYSVGISYSLLLADPLLMRKFLNTWSNIHQRIAYEGEIPKMPLFYAPNFLRPGCFRPAFAPTSSSSSTKSSNTTTFSISIHEKLEPGDEICEYLVMLCIEKAEKKLDSNMSMKFTLITKEPNGNVRVERSSKQSISGSPKSLSYELSPSSWEALRTNEVAFGRENVPIDVSHWIACDSLEGMVLVMISSLSDGKSSMKVFITVPSEEG